MKKSTGFILLSVFIFLTIIIGNVFALHYTPHWAVHIKGGPHVAQRVAADHGFVYLDEIMPDYYHFQGHGVARRSIEPHDYHQAKLDSDHRVHWAQQQKAKSRKKRDFLPSAIVTNPNIKSSVQLNDLRWQFMWYLNRGKGLDMNVLPAWEEGITGKGVVVTILDDGLEKDHPDLIRNFDPLASYDVNNHDEDPMPRYDMIDSNRHGTRCAGEVAAAANNTLCAVGVAFGASVGGVRMLDGDVTDAVEARSLSLNPQHIDIYSASWGPDDDGKTVDGPGELATRAFIEGVTKGRGGKGSIFVWASGNGGRDKDNCNCDGYTNSIWTLSISSATESGHVPWYSEACSSTLATTYSSGSVGEKQVVTTDLHHSCTSSHTGTSASAPLAAGICALALEANSNLTWRDMQHIVVRTAKTANLKANDWQVNGVGRNVSHSFGYGLMDASAMVRLARSWKTVPEQHKCEISAQITDPTIPPKSRKKFSLIVKNCPGVNYLEHVQAKITLTTLRRGDLEINLTSPAGTRSTLLEHRFHDFSRQGFLSWPFMSVHTWGEKPFGEWKLEIHNEGRTLITLSKLTEWELILYGTETLPNAGITKPAWDEKNPGGSSEIQINDLDQGMVVSSNDRWRGEEPQVGEELSHVNLQDATENVMNSSACAKSNGRICLDCFDGYVLYYGICVIPCPKGYFTILKNQTTKTELMEESTIDIERICEECHYTCLTCRGPNDFECTLCHPDSVLTNVSTTESYCYPTLVAYKIHSTKWFYRTYIIMLITLLIIFLFALLFILCNVYYRVCKSTKLKNSKSIYTKLSLSEIQEQINLEKKLIKTSGAGSDTE